MSPSAAAGGGAVYADEVLQLAWAFSLGPFRFQITGEGNQLFGVTTQK